MTYDFDHPPCDWPILRAYCSTRTRWRPHVMLMEENGAQRARPSRRYEFHLRSLCAVRVASEKYRVVTNQRARIVGSRMVFVY